MDATRGTTGQKLNSPDHITHHTLEDDTLEALQTKVGADSSAVSTSHDYLLQNLPAQASAWDAGNDVSVESLTATTIAGIASGNLVDKSAGESITGDWTIAMADINYGSAILNVLEATAAILTETTVGLANINYGSATLNNLDTTTISIGGTALTPIADELNFVDGVTSAIQTQLDGKLGVDNWEPQEYLQGDIDGSNTDFWVLNTPTKATAIIIKWNGQDQQYTAGFTVSGTAISFTFAMNGGTAWASYYH